MSTISASTTSTTAYKVTADTTGNLVLQTGSGPTTAVTIDTSQNMGLGVTPSAWSGSYKAIEFPGISVANLNGGTNQQAQYLLNAYDSGAGAWKYKITGVSAAMYRQVADGTHEWHRAPSGTAGNAISFTQAMTLDASGNLGVGTTSPSEKLDVAGFVKSQGLNASGTNISYITANNSNSYALILTCSSASPASEYIQSIRFSAAAPNNSSARFIEGTDNSATRFYFASNGGLANYQANNGNLSDRREKTNFSPAGDYLAKICAIPVQTFNYIDQNLEEDDGLTLGVVAQDVQEVAPELVTETNWGTQEEPKMRLSIYQTDLQYALMKCIQEQQAIIETLTNRITALEAK